MNNNNNTDPEYAVDSRYSSKEAQSADAVTFMKARLQRMQSLSKEQIIKAKLMQLKLNMENYLGGSQFNGKRHFLDFLRQYIDIIYSNKRDFARNIGITPVELSQVLNNHRKPKDSFLKKIIVHSEKVYTHVCRYSGRIWLEVYYHEQMSETMNDQNKWRADIENQISVNEASAPYKA